MKTIILLFLMMWFIPDVWGQQVEYVYDAAGNRTMRKKILSMTRLTVKLKSKREEFNIYLPKFLKLNHNKSGS